jgi:hypothetical protein
VERHQPPGPKERVFRDGYDALKESPGGSITSFRGSPKGTVPAVRPMAGATVTTGRPSLAWPAVTGATAYRVRLLDAEGKELWTETTKTPALPYPARRKALDHGDTYTWQVYAGKADGDRLVLTSDFEVLSEAVVKQLTALEPLVKGGDRADLLLAAATYHAYGVYDQALALYERLAREVPGEPAFHAACAAYYERGGRLDEARKALERAKKHGLVKPAGGEAR